MDETQSKWIELQVNDGVSFVDEFQLRKALKVRVSWTDCVMFWKSLTGIYYVRAHRVVISRILCISNFKDVLKPEYKV